MSSDLEIYRRVVARFTELVDSIDTAQWSAPTPDVGWDVADLIAHVVDRDRTLATVVGGPAVDELDQDDDLIAAWHERVEWWAARLADPVYRGTVFQTPWGALSFEQATVRSMTGELTIHGWDLARALGADETLDAEAVATTFASMQADERQLRRPGQLGAVVDVPDDADEQTRFLAFTGRRV